jgi:hypothetical protein
LAVGLERHLPSTVGNILRGATGCALLSFLHFVLGVPVPGPEWIVLSGASAGAGTIAYRHLTRASDEEEKRH